MVVRRDNVGALDGVGGHDGFDGVGGRDGRRSPGALDALRACFPILESHVNGRPLVYLDNAATMQMPRCVMDAVTHAALAANANVHRGAHALSQQATDAYEDARSTIADFMGCSPEEAILTSGTTDGLNRVAAMLAPMLTKGDRVLVSGMEHHANLLPWMNIASRTGAELAVAPVGRDGSFDAEAFLNMIDGRTKVVAITQVSNVSGAELPVGDVVAAARREGALTVVDGAQGAAHASCVGAATGADAYVFSGHKMGAPTGTGALFVRKGLLDMLEPVTFGGGAIASVSVDGFVLRDDVTRFEPGTPNYQGFAGMAEALRFWSARNRETDLAHEARLLERLVAAVEDIPGVHVVAPGQSHHGAVSLWFDAGTSYDACRLLDASGIATRSGHHCAQPYLATLELAEKGALRVSVAPYNTDGEIDACADAIETAARLMGCSR